MEFIDLNKEEPLLIFKDKYKKAKSASQKNIEAMTIASFNKLKNEVDCRYVNLKFVKEDNFIFFTNYDSPKSAAFESNDKIAAIFYWDSINTQIRIKANIKRTSIEFNNNYFKERCIYKNALAISSHQSKTISSYSEVIKNFEYAKNNKDLSVCPDYWGGYSFKPFEIEFWEGRNSRLNKRDLYMRNDDDWTHAILQP